MNDLDLLISSEQIKQAIDQVAPSLFSVYQNKDPVFVCILKGSICFVSDLMKKLSFPLTLEFLQAKSYVGEKPQELTVQSIDFSIRDRHVLVIDDILDRGQTLLSITQLLQFQKPHSLKTMVLLKKKTNQKAAIQPDYSLFDVEDRFVIGYGLDYNEHYRNLNGIYAFK